MIDYLKRSFDRLSIATGRKDEFNLPNTITLLRIGVVPLLFFLLLPPGLVGSFLIAVLFIAAALTDLLDGYIARKYHLVTTFGKFLDPIADKLLVNVALILMIPTGRVPAWIAVVMVARDIAVEGMRSIASAQGAAITPSTLGKRKTLAQVAAVSALIIHYPLFGIDAHLVGTVILYLALVLTVASGIDYFLKFQRLVLNR